MAHPVDIHVGQRVRHRRWLVGMTQQQLANAVGIKFQQIQKYESGANRISASRLWDLSNALGVPVSFFFDGLERAPAAAQARHRADSNQSDLLSDKETIELVRAYYAIEEGPRRRLLDLAKALNHSEHKEPVPA
ncbi:MAG: helix-turn-helix transcriptional regulator [Alphaproteobacteria bacterium]|nr:helix-turn-helix transcriptional regulator [Alphaproteobacteria bacterium]